jgi:hypothetical protein
MDATPPSKRLPLPFDIEKFIGHAWRRLDGASREVLQQRAQHFSDDYRAAMAQWNATEQGKDNAKLLREAKTLLPPRIRVVSPFVPPRTLLPKPNVGRILLATVRNEAVNTPVENDPVRRRRMILKDENVRVDQKKRRYSTTSMQNTPDPRPASRPHRPPLLTDPDLLLYHLMDQMLHLSQQVMQLRSESGVPPRILYYCTRQMLHLSQQVAQLQSELSSVVLGSLDPVSMSSPSFDASTRLVSDAPPLRPFGSPPASWSVAEWRAIQALGGIVGPPPAESRTKDYAARGWK